MAIRGGPDIIEDGLVLHLDAADQNSYPLTGNIWYDMSGNGNNVVLYNGPTHSLQDGGIFTFDGTNDYGTNGNASGMNFNSTNQITAEAWMKVNPNGYDFWFSSNDIYYRFGTASNGRPYWDMGRHADKSTTPSLTTNAWYHFVFVGYPGSSSVISDIYLNGAFSSRTTDTAISSFSRGISIFYVGTGESPTAHPFKGSISSLKIYNSALSADEILQNYNATKGRYGL